MNYLRQHNAWKYVKYGIVALAMVISIPLISAAYESYASVDYYNLMVGDKTVAVFTSENDAKQVIKDVKNYYVDKGAKLEDVKCDPELKVEQVTYNKNQEVEFADVDELVEYLVTGDKKTVTYVVKEGDVYWDIAADNDISRSALLSMNPQIKDTEDLHPGDEIYFYTLDPIVDVTTVQVVTSKRSIDYKTITKESSELEKGCTEVKREGKEGRKRVTERVTTENGVVSKVKELKSKTLKKPVNKIVLVGTKEVVVETPTATQGTATVTNTTTTTSTSYSGGRTYSGSGNAIASYGMQFIGNPYKYGGTSLTNGADCSGFVKSVYAHYGISLPHGSSIRGSGRSVSYSSIRPGDIICQPGHVGIYVGGGKMVHAMNYRKGITVTHVSTTGSVQDVRRVVE